MGVVLTSFRVAAREPEEEATAEIASAAALEGRGVFPTNRNLEKTLFDRRPFGNGLNVTPVNYDANPFTPWIRRIRSGLMPTPLREGIHFRVLYLVTTGIEISN
jgi:hypothetical protein